MDVAAAHGYGPAMSTIVDTLNSGERGFLSGFEAEAFAARIA